jgi:hypothetical protein
VSGAKGNIDEKKLSSWKLLDNFRQRLAKVQAAFPKSEKRPGGPVRLLLEKDYFSLMLFGLLNPVLDSMRGLRMQRGQSFSQPYFLTPHEKSMQRGQSFYKPYFLTAFSRLGYLPHEQKSTMVSGVADQPQKGQSFSQPYFLTLLSCLGNSSV